MRRNPDTAEVAPQNWKVQISNRCQKLRSYLRVASLSGLLGSTSSQGRISASWARS